MDPIAEPPSTDASHRLLSAPELVLYVLNYLPAHDLLAVSRANKYLRETIRQSSLLVSRLSRGPLQHYSDLPPSLWTFENTKLNTTTFTSWTREEAQLLYPDEIACCILSGHYIPRPVIRLRRGKSEHGPQLQFEWMPTSFFDPIRDKVVASDKLLRSLMDTISDAYPTDPPLPTVIKCVASPFAGSHSRPFEDLGPGAWAEVDAGLCTLGDMIRIALALSISLPPDWDARPGHSIRDRFEWRPYVDHPELVRNSEFTKAIDMIRENRPCN